MPEENLVQHPTTITATPGDELSTEEWLKQRNAPPARSEEESKTAEVTEPSQQEQERDEAGKFKPKEESEDKVPPGVQKRIDKAVAKQREAERERDEARQRLQAVQAPTPAAVEQPKPAESELKAPVKPQLKDFADWDLYEAAKDKWTIELAEHTAKSAVAADRKARTEAEARSKAEEQNKAVASEWDKSVEVARESHEDYDEKIDQAKADIKAGKFKSLNDSVLGAIVASDAKAELLYHLVSNPEDLERISSLPLHMVGYALGKLEVELKLGGKEPRKAAPEKPVKPNPKPPEPVTGKASASSGPSEEDSTEEWLRKRNAQVKAKGKPY